MPKEEKPVRNMVLDGAEVPEVTGTLSLSSSLDPRCSMSVTCKQAIKIHSGSKSFSGDLNNVTTEIEASVTVTEAQPGSMSEAELYEKVLNNVSAVIREKLEENSLFMESMKPQQTPAPTNRYAR